MDPYVGLDGGFENLAALGSAAALLVGVFVLVQHMLEIAIEAADRARGRANCHFCGAPLPSCDGLGYAARCRACERGQPWA